MQFIYLADTHFGGSDELGYRQQQRYLRYADELFAALAVWLKNHPEVCFVIHGGDLLESYSDEVLEIARKKFSQLPVPTYLALGNHDLTESDSLDHWLKNASEFFPAGKADYSLLFENLRLDILAVHWGSEEYLWKREEEQVPYFSKKQLEVLRSDKQNNQWRILISHAPPCGLPAEQTGLPEELHPPSGNFTETLNELAEELQLDLVLGAHNHMNLAVQKQNCHMVTVSAFTEMPFEFKLFEIDNEQLKMKTVTLANEITFKTEYDYEKNFVQGRSKDRNLLINAKP